MTHVFLGYTTADQLLRWLSSDAERIDGETDTVQKATDHEAMGQEIPDGE